MIVLPLVGHIDTRRAQDITAVLLQGVAVERARVAILDITGVAAVDTHVLGLLLGAMRGAEPLAPGRCWQASPPRWPSLSPPRVSRSAI